MLLPEIEFQRRYRTSDFKDIGKAFIDKALQASVCYKRAVGFFSSSALINLTRGLSSFLKNKNPHIYFVVSPELSKEDIDAINKGYESREKVLEVSMLRNFRDTDDDSDSERLNLLTHLIEEGILDIKIAVMENEKGVGIYHEKFGVFEDESGNKVAFDGSLNESNNAFACNFERVSVYCSWKGEKDAVDEFEGDFDSLWRNQTPELKIYDFPDAVKKKLMTYRKDTYNRNIDDIEKMKKEYLASHLPTTDLIPYQPRDYQKKAINSWAANHFRGIFDRATGTGKTLTAYWAAVSLMKRRKYNLAVIIVCPYRHLVEQWVEDAGKFNINFIIGYGDAKYRGYLDKLRNTVIQFNNHIQNYFFFITTTNSFKTPAVQSVLKSIRRKEVLFIADEVHNFGAPGLRQALLQQFPYRIGLSATVNRAYDTEGTEAIYSYFGQPVIHFGLKEAIDGGFLTKYFYYVIPVSLTPNERDLYLDLTDKMIQASKLDDSGKLVLTEKGKRYAIKRARVIATAKDKLTKLKENRSKYKTEHNILVYCGSGHSFSEEDEDKETKSQIEQVCSVLGNELNRKVQRFTAKESVEERSIITNAFKNQELQAVVAMKCLDEGVNIPCIKYAFIMASGSNPSEYVQRRGRVLRKFPGKSFSYIFDFVTLPFIDKEICSYPEDYVLKFSGLVKSEIKRMKEFSSLAINASETELQIQDLMDLYQISYDDINKYCSDEETEEDYDG